MDNQNSEKNFLQFGSKHFRLNKYSHPTKLTTAKIVCLKTYITVDTVASSFYIKEGGKPPFCSLWPTS